MAGKTLTFDDLLEFDRRFRELTEVWKLQQLRHRGIEPGIDDEEVKRMWDDLEAKMEALAKPIWTCEP